MQKPFTPAALQQIVSETLDREGDGELPGHRSWCARLRPMWSECMLVKDKDAIPSKLTLRERLPCWRAHPGLCRTADDWCWAELTHLARGLDEHFLTSAELGEFYKVQAMGSTGQRFERHVLFGFRRLAKPRIALHIRCTIDGGSLIFDVQANGVLLVNSSDMVVKSILEEARKAAEPRLHSIIIYKLRVQGLNVQGESMAHQKYVVGQVAASAPSSVATPSEVEMPLGPAGLHFKKIMDDGLLAIQRSSTTSAPTRSSTSSVRVMKPKPCKGNTQRKTTAQTDSDPSSSDDSLEASEDNDTDNLEAAMMSLVKKGVARKKPGVTIDNPPPSKSASSKAGGADIGAASAVEPHSGSACASSLVGDTPAAAAPDAVIASSSADDMAACGAAGSSGPARAPPVQPIARESRFVPWGRWSLAPLYRQTGAGKIQIGWGANCHEHVNATDIFGRSPRCQKLVTYGSGPTALNDAECKRLAKCWLLMGESVQAGDSARSDHVRMNVRRHAPGDWTDDYLDQRVGG